MSKPSATRRDFLQATSMLAGATLAGTSASVVAPSGSLGATGTAETGQALTLRLQTPDVVEFQIRNYLMKRVPALPQPKSAAEWSAQQQRLRKHLLEKVIFHGWPKPWIDARPKFEDHGLIPSGKGYRLRKLRYEIVPGFQSTALLYEPDNASGRVPATINLNGHDPSGKAAPYKQKRCINNALQGMFALSLEWMGMGEMASAENDHWNGAHLNLVGASATGLFYLAIRRGLDYLCEHPKVDPGRIGATGLSGGAWQTIIISALDERVAAAIPVSGYFSFTSAIERNSDIGDMEYHPHDLFVEGDYSTLTAMLAPRPALLIYGAMDQYGLRAPLQKPHLYDEIKPFFKLYGKEDNFAWHENVEPGTHSYELDSRQQSYTFFTKHFSMPVVDREVPVDGEVKTPAELKVGVPADNLTIFDLAKKLANSIKRPAVPSDKASQARWARELRARLKDVVRYKPVTVKHAWPLYSTRGRRVETMGYRLQFSNNLSATAVSARGAKGESDGRVAILLDDSGAQPIRLDAASDRAHGSPPFSAAETAAARRIERGERVLAVNLIFTGDASPDKPKNEPVNLPELYDGRAATTHLRPHEVEWLETRPPSALYGLLLSAAGDHPLGMQAAQLIAIADWLRKEHRSKAISLETTGIRNQVTALVAAALEPAIFSDLTAHQAMRSLKYLIDSAIRYQDAPDLFCLDLLKDVDIEILASLAKPTKITQEFMNSRPG